METQNISSTRLQRHQEQEFTRQQLELRNLRSDFEKKIKHVVEENEKKLSDIKQAYRIKGEYLDNDLNKKLIALRSHQTFIIKDEQERLEKELDNIKKRHENQVSELGETNSSQIDKMKENHTEVLENAKRKFLKTKAKWDV